MSDNQKPPDAYSQKPNSFKEFFAKSVIIRSNAIINRITQLEKIVYTITCAQCMKVISHADYRVVCACGMTYCSDHGNCCSWERDLPDRICIRCRPDLVDFCLCTTNIYQPDTKGFKKIVVRRLVCKECKSTLCGSCKSNSTLSYLDIQCYRCKN